MSCKPRPNTGEGGRAPISAATPKRSSESSHGLWSDAPAIRIEPGAVVELYCSHPFFLTEVKPIAVVARRLLRLGARHKAGWVFGWSLPLKGQ